MTLDNDLLEKAKTAGTGLAEAERQVLLARAEYHTAIRRLHLAGGPLREIAEALSFSHQRVQQIVDASGGSWWRHAWGTRNAKRDAVCTWCERPPSEVAKLVAGPNVYICDACVALNELVLQRSGGGTGGLKTAAEGSKERCSFCNKRRSKDRSVVVGPSANICSECVQVCRGFVD